MEDWYLSYKLIEFWNFRDINHLEHNQNLEFLKANLERELKAFHVSKQNEQNNVYKTDTKIRY